MFNLFDLNLISIILKRFKVKKIIISSLYYDEVIEEILENYKKPEVSISFINSNKHLNMKDNIEIPIEKIRNLKENNSKNPTEIINDYILDALPELNNYDAVFLHDDPNWFTLYNELNIIKNNNKEFPLVFIYNNKYPFKYRDGYVNPNIIPQDYLINNSVQLPISFNGEEIYIEDGLYHAIYEKTPKNGVLTAINDFLIENNDIGLMNIQLGEISILYSKSTISKIRIDKIYEEIEENNLSFREIPDELIENQLLLNHISQITKNLEDISDLKIELSEKNNIINEYENKISIHDNELNLKNTQIAKNMEDITDLKTELSEKNNIINEYENKISIHDEELNLKNSQIGTINEELNFKNLKMKNIESKLENNQIEISKLKNQLNTLNNEINHKETYYENFESNIKNEFTKKEKNLKQQILDKETRMYNTNQMLKLKETELEEKENLLNALKQRYATYSSKLDTKEYCISCYKEEISNNKQEINYFKNKNTLLKKIFEPFAYIYLILKSKPKEISLNIKLYKALKNSKCFDIGYYLSKNSDISESKWCKYFSPELHYVCNGFSENRKFNKKYFNRNSKKDLLEYILTCNY